MKRVLWWTICFLIAAGPARAGVAPCFDDDDCKWMTLPCRPAFCDFQIQTCMFDNPLPNGSACPGGKCENGTCVQSDAGVPADLAIPIDLATPANDLSLSVDLVISADLAMTNLAPQDMASPLPVDLAVALDQAGSDAALALPQDMMPLSDGATSRPKDAPPVLKQTAAGCGCRLASPATRGWGVLALLLLLFTRLPKQR